MTVDLLKPAPRFARAPLVRYLALATLVGLLLGALGPFGSYMNDGFPMRAAYWIASLWIGFAVYGAAVVAWRRITPVGTTVSWLALVALILLASVPQAIITRTLAFRVWPHLADLGLSWTTWYLQVAILGLVISIGFVTVRLSMARTQVLDAPEGECDKSGQSLQMLARLAPDVLALQMEDHYVRIHTLSGSRLVLMPLGQAIGSLAAKDGLRTHRSWWVARDAVKRINGTPRSMTLILTNGVVAPVARSAVATIRSAGWLERGGSSR